jgi:histidinol-phosphate phosphatase family protein
MIQVVVLAGGQGTRLKAVTGDSPKPLACANGRPLLDLQLEHFAACGITNVIVLTGYGGEEIKAFCGDGTKWGLSVQCVRERESRGTAGAVFDAQHLLASDFLVTYGDTVFDVDVSRMVAMHRRGRQIGTLLVHPNDHPHDSDLVAVDTFDRIVAFHPYPHDDSKLLPNLVNAGMYVLSREIFSAVDNLPDRPDFGKHVFPRLVASGCTLAGYRSPEYIKDAGTPSRLAQVSSDLALGLVQAKSLRGSANAVFMDRDGTINVEKGHIAHPRELDLYPGSAEAIARLNHSSYRSILVTNQAVVARGDCSEEDLQLIHNRLEMLLGRHGAYLDRIYYCPHIPNRGFPGERIELKVHCNCRKPDIGMLMRASQELNLNLHGSWLIGDSTGDLEAARRAGITSILVSTGHGGWDGKWRSPPDVECLDLSDAVSLILDRWQTMLESFRSLESRIGPGDIVLIGGQARSGKSQHAAALRRCLAMAGKTATVIHLDSWLRDEGARFGESVLDRYDLRAAAAFMQQATAGGHFFLPRYDRQSRRQHRDAWELNLRTGTVLVVEGVPALADKLLTDMAQHRVALHRNEEKRQASMRLDYGSRGWSPNRIDELIIERAAEESPLIEDSLRIADIILESKEA